jgi:hypothetical protein
VPRAARARSRGVLAAGARAVNAWAHDSPGDPSTDLCPGSDQNPLAAEGILCLYVTQSAGMDLTSFASDIWPLGVHWHFNNNNTVSVGDDFFVRGVYAVTAGSAFKLKHRSDHK